MSPTAGFTGLKAAWTNSSIPGNATLVATLSGSFPQVQNKPFGVSANSGTTYVVAGSGGQLSSATLQFPSKAAVAGQTVSCALDIATVTLRLRRAVCPSIRIAPSCKVAEACRPSWIFPFHRCCVLACALSISWFMPRKNYVAFNLCVCAGA